MNRFLSRDCELIIGDNPKKRLFLCNPEDVLKSNAPKSLERIMKGFGKIEVEEFVIDKIYTETIFQTHDWLQYQGNNNKPWFIDLSLFADIEIRYYYSDDNDISICPKKEFLKKLLALPIFEIYEEQGDEIYLLFVS